MTNLEQKLELLRTQKAILEKLEDELILEIAKEKEQEYLQAFNL